MHADGWRANELANDRQFVLQLVEAGKGEEGLERRSEETKGDAHVVDVVADDAN